MTRTANDIMAEIMQIEAKIEGPEGKGKVTILKAYHRKLCAQYRKALGL